MVKSDVICLHFLETPYLGPLFHESAVRLYFIGFVNPSLCIFSSLIFWIIYIYTYLFFTLTYSLIYQASRKEFTLLDKQNKARITETNNVIVENTEKSFYQKSVYICPQTT